MCGFETDFAFFLIYLKYGQDIPPPMAEEQVTQPNAEEKKASIPKMIAGATIALAIGIAMMYFGLFNQCCGLGYLMIACVALYVPKFFGMNKMQHLIILGVVFFLVLTLLGAFVVSKPMFKDNSDVAAFDDNGFSNVTITYDNGTADIQVSYTGTSTDLKACFYQVQSVTYQMITKTKGENFEHPLEPTTTPGVYRIHEPVEAPAGFVYLLEFHYTDGTEEKSTSYVYFTGAASDSEITNFCLLYNAYTSGIVIIIFFLMLVLTTIMRRNLEKTRARMEAEGRLYPQGYGRCKECGSIVLPGETCCRKCGAYIDVPDELRHRKVDMVQCSECGAEIPEDAKVCPKCGANFDEEEEVVYVENAQPAKEIELVQCSECGEMIPETAEVCPKCGATFDEEEEIVVEEKKE